MKTNFNFEECAAWILGKVSALALSGTKFEIRRNDAIEMTIYVQLSNLEVEGSLVVWERGRVAMSVFSFLEKETIFNQDIEISSDDYAEKISQFFRLLERQ